MTSGFAGGPAIRTALVDDHELFRAALGTALEGHGFQMVVEGSDARTTFAQIDSERPELVLLDLRLPHMDGITALRELRARDRAMKVVILTSSERQCDIDAAWLAGASGYATKRIKLELLVDGLNQVMSGRRFLQPDLCVIGSHEDEPLFLLSMRERDVFRLIVQGMTSQAIALQLCISVKTVCTHRDRLMNKLGVHSAVQLVRFAADHDLLS